MQIRKTSQEVKKMKNGCKRENEKSEDEEEEECMERD